jgi:hypothetical protein
MVTSVLERRNKNANKTKIDWDLNIFCPEQWYGGESFWDPDLWKINARIYIEDGDIVNVIDTDYTITLLTKEAYALGLVAWGQYSNGTASPVVANAFNNATDLDGWLDQGLDGFLSLGYFDQMYRDKSSDRITEFLDTLPQYLEDVPARMTY